MKVGLLEDDLAQAERMQALLAKLGYQPEHFSTGKSLLESLRRSSFDLLLIDWELPDMSGIDVLKMVRTVVDWHIPILFVTQRDSESDVVTALEAGADDYLVKEVRERTGWGTSMIKVRAFRARRKLKKHFAALMKEHHS